jgi:hypothetical protein
LNGKEDSARASIAHWASEVSILLVEDAPRKEAHRRLVKKEERKLLFSFVLQERKLLFCLVIGAALLGKKKGPYGPWLIVNSVSIQNVNVPFIQFLPFLHRQGGLFSPMLCHRE